MHASSGSPPDVEHLSSDMLKHKHPGCKANQKQHCKQVHVTKNLRGTYGTPGTRGTQYYTWYIIMVR